MKLLHLSDLHLGKRIYEYSMLEDQRGMLDQVLTLARQADATLIAGDIYDRQVPPAEAVALFDEFLTHMSEQGSPVLLIAGNHDSAERIAFGARLLGKSGVYVSPVYRGEVRCVIFEDEYGPVHIHLLPFVKPAHVRAALAREDIEGYTQAIAAAIGEMTLTPDARHVLAAHQFVTGAVRSESEEISVGGLDQVDADIFAPFDYVALGHLHTAQTLLGGRVRYSGAPLSYAFSETNGVKGALLVTLDASGMADVQQLPIVPLHPMRTVRGTFDELMCAPHSTDYVQVTLTDEDDIPDAAGKLRGVYENLMQVLYDNARTRAEQADFTRTQTRQPMELFEALYAAQNGAPMTTQQHDLLRDMMVSIWEDEA